MATYRLWLTVKDSTGKTKEIDGGTVNIDLTKLTDTEATTIASRLDLDSYATDQEVSDALASLPENIEDVVEETVPEIIVKDEVVKEKIIETVASNLNAINYESFVEEEEVTE